MRTSHLRQIVIATTCALTLCIASPAGLAHAEEAGDVPAAPVEQEHDALLALAEEGVTDTVQEVPSEGSEEQPSPVDGELTGGDATQEQPSPAAAELLDEADETDPVGESTEPEAVADDEPADEAGEATDPEADTATETVEEALEPCASSSNGSAAAVIAEGTYFIQSAIAANRMVDASGTNPQSGSNVATWTYNGAANQKWILIRGDEYNHYRLVIQTKSGMLSLAAVQSGSSVNACVLDATKTTNFASLLWSFVDVGDGAYHLMNAAFEGMCLDVAGASTDRGANLCLWKEGGTTKANQRFLLINANPSVAAGTTGLEGAYVLHLENAPSDLVADISGGSSANGGNLIVWKPKGADNQMIYLEEDPDDPGFYIAWIVGTGKVLDIERSYPYSGANVLQWTKNGNANQKWAVVPSSHTSNGYVGTTLVNKATGLVLGVQGTTAGANVAGMSTGSPNATFTLVPTALINEGITVIRPLVNQSLALDVSGASTGTAGLVLWTDKGSTNQRFELISVGTNLYRIRTASSGGWLTWTGGNTVVQTGKGADAKTNANTWRAVYKNGGISLINLESKLALDMYGGSANKGTNIIAYTSHGKDGQHFRFVAADLFKSGVYFIQSYHNASDTKTRVLDVDHASKDAGANVLAYTNNAKNNQKFVVEKSYGAYTIRNVNSNLYVGVKNSSKEHEANVVQDMSAQLWLAEIADGGYLRFVNVNSGMSLEAPSGASANVVQFRKGEAPKSESWKLVSTTANVKLVADAAPAKAVRTGKCILIVGNSFTYYNDLGHMVSYITGADVTTITKSAGYLREQVDAVRSALSSGSWDYVIIQERSDNPIRDYNDYLSNLSTICTLARNAGATPIIYGTWAYASYGNVNQMSSQLQSAFSRASASTGATVANVTKAFADKNHASSLYVSDRKHASATGTQLAASTIANTVKGS